MKWFHFIKSQKVFTLGECIETLDQVHAFKPVLNESSYVELRNQVTVENGNGVSSYYSVQRWAVTIYIQRILEKEIMINSNSAFVYKNLINTVNNFDGDVRLLDELIFKRAVYKNNLLSQTDYNYAK